MQIYLAADHRGYEMKNELKGWLQAEGYAVTDVGAETLDTNDDYSDFGIQLGERISESPQERRGIGLCGSGAGIAVAANKVAGVRAALVHDAGVAAAARADDDINLLALGSDFISVEEAKTVVGAFLTTEFKGEERHQRRLRKITDYESNVSKSANS